jgi:hypothetical protein
MLIKEGKGEELKEIFNAKGIKNVNQVKGLMDKLPSKINKSDFY